MSLDPITTDTAVTGYRLTINDLIAALATVSDDLDSSEALVQMLIGAEPAFGNPVLDVGMSGQLRAGRALTTADFNPLIGAATPIGLFNLGSTANLGSGGALTNKGSVQFGSGITGATPEAALFTGSSTQALYIADTGTGDPFRISTGSWGGWARTAVRATEQTLVSKWGSGGSRSWLAGISSGGLPRAAISIDGTAIVEVIGTTDVADDRWHQIVASYDGVNLRLFVDGALEASATTFNYPLYNIAAPLNVGSYAATSSVNPSAPLQGRADEVFVSATALSLEQVRLLYAVRLDYGAVGDTPRAERLAVGRRRRGERMPPTSAFPSTPKRLYNPTATGATDTGIDGQSLTLSGAPRPIVNAGGRANSAFLLDGAADYLTATDASLPTAGQAGALGAWFRVTAEVAALGYALPIFGYGASPGRYIGITSAGLVTGADFNGTAITGTLDVRDGAWHFAVASFDPSASDGYKSKLYLDGSLIATSTSIGTTGTTAGAGGLRLGRTPGGSAFLLGAVGGAFVTNAALDSMAIRRLLYSLDSSASELPQSPLDPGSHIEAVNTESIYLICDTLAPEHIVYLRTAG